MEAERIRSIINIYSELKAKGGRFSEVEPCFVEGNDYIAKLWTTRNQNAGSGNENPFDIDIEDIGGGDGDGENPKEGGIGEGRGQNEKGATGGTGATGGIGSTGATGGKGGTGATGEGEGEGEGSQHGSEGEGEPNEEGKSQAPPKAIEQPEFSQDEEEDISEYKMQFPIITEMIYGVKFCNTTSEQIAKEIERKLFVGIGITICRNLMAEAGMSGDSVLYAKKEAYRGIFDMLLIISSMRNSFDEQGNIVVLENSGFDEQSYQELILSDKFLAKTLPMFAIFNTDVFNQKQVDSAIDFCMARMDEKRMVLVTDKYTNENVEPIWGLLIFDGENKRNYKINYYKYRTAIESGKIKKTLDKLEAVSVYDGNFDLLVNLEAMGDEFYAFVRALILNYVNNDNRTLQEHWSIYNNKKRGILDSASNILSESITNLERLI